jgi:hypothetical protein
MRRDPDGVNFVIDMPCRDNKGCQQVCKLMFTAANILYGSLGRSSGTSAFPSHPFGPPSFMFHR